MIQPNWDLANCKGTDPNIFFPDDDLDKLPSDIERICENCEIKEFCLNWSLDTKQVGIWGGTTQKQRRKMLRRVVRTQCPGCASQQIISYELADVSVCTSCGISWRI